MRAVTLLMLGLLALVPARAAASERALAGSSTYLYSGRTFSQSPYYYRYTSPYYYRGGFLSPYVHPAPRYSHPRVTPRYDPSYRYDRTGRFDTRRYDRSYHDRFDNGRFDHSYNHFDRGRVDRFHRPVPSVTPRLRVPAPGTNDRYHFRGGGSFRGGGGGAGSIGRR